MLLQGWDIDINEKDKATNKKMKESEAKRKPKREVERIRKEK